MLEIIAISAAAAAAPSFITNELQIAKTAKYPRQDAKASFQGRNKVRISVDSRGRQYRCEVLQRSGSDSLDTQSCKEFMTKGKFTAARDLNGAPITGQITLNFNWWVARSTVAPNMTMLPDLAFVVNKIPGNVGFAWVEARVLVDDKGIASDCALVKASEIAAIDRVACATILANSTFAAALDNSGKPVKSMQKFSAVFAPSDTAVLDPSIRLSNGELPPVISYYSFAKEDTPSRKAVGAEGTTTVRLIISSASSVKGCDLIRSSGSVLLDTKTCDIAIRNMKFRAGQSIDGGNIERPFDLTVQWQRDSPCRGVGVNSFCVSMLQ